jgi:acyl-CoA oxidase
MVVIADLVVGGRHFGAHGFLVRADAPGVVAADMGPKTSFNALDNAELSFQHVLVPPADLLSKTAWDPAKYTSATKSNEASSFIAVAQRLLSGRLCIADAIVEGTRAIMATTENYAASRPVCIDRTTTSPLSELPVFRRAMDRHKALLYVHTVNKS